MGSGTVQWQCHGFFVGSAWLTAHRGIYMVGMDSSNETATRAYASDIENGLFVLDLTSPSSSSSYWWILAACGGAVVVIGAAGVALFLYMRHRRVQYFTAEDDVEVL